VICTPLVHRYWHPRIEGYYWPADTVELVLMKSPISTQRTWQFAPRRAPRSLLALRCWCPW